MIIKHVWAAAHPQDPSKIEISFKEPVDYDFWFDDEEDSACYVSAEWKSAMLVTED